MWQASSLRLNSALIVLLAISAALPGCTLTLDTAPPTPAGQVSNAGGGADSGSAPVARIVDPVSGVTVAVNQRLDITVETDSTATRFQLNVSGQVASTKALPAEQSGPTSAILSWTPRREGTYNLEIIAYNSTRAGPPATLTVTVSGTAGGAAAPDAAPCTGRALVSQLNFRDGPGTGSTKLGQFQTGETVSVIGRNSDNTWLKVQRMNAQQVWAINNPQWLQTEGQCGNVPVVE